MQMNEDKSDSHSVITFPVGYFANFMSTLCYYEMILHKNFNEKVNHSHLSCYTLFIPWKNEQCQWWECSAGACGVTIWKEKKINNKVTFCINNLKINMWIVDTH